MGIGTYFILSTGYISVSKHNPITWSAKQRDLLTIDTSQDTGRDGHRPAGYRRPDEDNEAPHLRICEAITGDRSLSLSPCVLIVVILDTSVQRI